VLLAKGKVKKTEIEFSLDLEKTTIFAQIFRKITAMSYFGWYF